MRSSSLAAVFVALIVLLVARVALADTLEAPINGRAIPLGETRVACGPVPGGWQIEPGGRALRPPSAASAVGISVELKVATSLLECAKSTESVTLVATAPWPSPDASAWTLAVDEGRLEGHGKNLRGMIVTWPQEADLGSDTCHEPKGEGGGETCTWGIPKTLSADPIASALHWLPAGARAVDGATLFSADGKKVPPDALAIVPSRVEVAHLLPADASIDVSPGIGLVPLLRAEVVASVDCGATRCSFDAGTLSVQPPPASATTLDVKVRLAPHVFYTGKGAAETQPTLRLSIVRCPMSVVSGPVLRATDSARTVVKLGGACAAAMASLHFFIGSHRADVIEVQTAKDESYAVLSVGNVDASNLSITVVRGESDASVVAVARTDTRVAPRVRSVLEIQGFPPIDFIPNNRSAIVHFPKVAGALLTLLSQEDVYEAKTKGGVTTVQGDVNAAGAVTLVFAYRVPTLPSPLDQIDIAVLSDSLQRNVREANLPAPIGAMADSPSPLVEMICFDADGKNLVIKAGIAVHLPFAVREGCRVVIHRERILPEWGTQKLALEIEVDKVDGSSRGEAHVTQTVVLRAGSEPRVAWVKGVRAPYDRIIVRISHVADEAHYLGALEIPSGAPAAQWSVVLGTGRVRLYATSTIPTGLYRFGGASASGVLSLSFGILSRFTWLDIDGHEGLVGLEAGVMAFGLTGDTSTGGQSLTQVGGVVGLGIAIPIANSGGPTQASINLHAWFEQRFTGGGGHEENSPRAIIFGPSISIGNVGTTF
jgi:hypothetical protein